MVQATESVRGGAGATARSEAALGRPKRYDQRSHTEGGEEPGRCLVACVEEDLTCNFGEQITLRDIANSSGYSVYQIIRTFRRRLGVTPHAYLVRMRLHYAAEMLLSGDTIAGAAAEAGFSDQSHMTRHFKREFGTTPRQYLLNQHCSVSAT